MIVNRYIRYAIIPYFKKRYYKWKDRKDLQEADELDKRARDYLFVAHHPDVSSELHDRLEADAYKMQNAAWNLRNKSMFRDIND